MGVAPRPVLNGLLEEGLIEKVEETEERKKIYSITKEGKKELFNWLMEPTQYQPGRSEFLLKFSFSNNLPKENIIKMLEEYKTRHISNLEQFQEMEEYFNQEDKEILPERELFLYAPLRLGILSTEATIKWCDEILARQK